MEEKKDITQELEKIKAELEELKKKLSETEGKGITDLPKEAFHRVSEVAQDIVRSAMEIAEKSFLVVKSAAEGAIEGAKRAMKEEEKKE